MDGPFRACAVLLVAGAFVSRASGDAPISLDEAVAIALAANESLAAARLKLPPARAAIDVARQRPNPDLTLEAQREAPHDAIALALPIETAGKRGRRVRLAEAGAGTADAELGRTTLEVRNDVRRAYFALCAAERRAVEAEGLRDLADRAREAAKARFESGAAPRLEQLQAELGAAQADNEAYGARATASAARSDLNVLLARRPDHPTTTSDDLGAGRLPGPEEAGDAALASSTEIALFDRRILEETSRRDLARAEQWPDLVVGGGLTHDAPGEFDYGWRASLGLTLPLFHHRRAEVRVQEGVLDQLQAERTAAVSRIRGAVFSALAVAVARREQYERYRVQILPQTGEVERMAEEAYRSGQTGLVAMIQTIQAVRDLRAKAVQAGLDYQAALADLERAMGAPLP